MYAMSCKGSVLEPQSGNQYFISVRNKIILDPHQNLIEHVYIMVEYLNQEPGDSVLYARSCKRSVGEQMVSVCTFVNQNQVMMQGH